MKRIALLTTIAAVTVAALGVPALAGGNDSRIDLVMSTKSADADGPSYGESVSFALTNPKTPRPEVRLVCGKDAAYYPPTQAVLDKTLPYYGEGTREFRLASDAWTSGGNTCVAWLMRKGQPVVGTIFYTNG